MISGLQWEQLFGRTDRFAIRLGLGTDERALGFGRIEIWVNGRCLTRNEHGILGSETAVRWDLTEIVRWIVRNLRSIATEGEFPNVLRGVATAAEWLARSLSPTCALTDEQEEAWFRDRFGFWSEHSLGSIGGVAVPDIVFRRVLNDMEISWTTRLGTTRGDIRWIESEGAARFAVVDVVPPLLAAVAAAAQRLEPLGGDLASEVRSLRDDEGLTDPESRPFSLAASGSTIGLNDDDREKLRNLAEATCPGTSSTGKLPLTPTRPSLQRPWEGGYKLAREYRDSMAWQNSPLPDLSVHMGSLGVDVGDIELSPRDLHGLSIVGPSRRPTVRCNTRSWRAGPSWSRQMLLAHELCHLLYDWSPTEDFSMLSSKSADWPTEARANAFAAELVMPRDGVADLLAGRAIDSCVLVELMKRFRVGIRAATWHLFNLEILSHEQRDELLEAHSRD